MLHGLEQKNLSSLSLPQICEIRPCLYACRQQTYPSEKVVSVYPSHNTGVSMACYPPRRFIFQIESISSRRIYCKTAEAAKPLAPVLVAPDADGLGGN